METLGVSSAYHKTACKLVNDDNFTFADDIVNIALHNSASADSLIDVVEEFCIFRIGEILDSECTLGFCNTGCCKRCTSVLFVYDVIAVCVVVFFLIINRCNNNLAKCCGKAVSFTVNVSRLFALT